MTIRIEERGQAVIVQNTSTKRGALSSEFYRAIQEGCARATSKRVLILAGRDYFCAGGDLDLIRTRQSLSVAQRRAQIEFLNQVVCAISDCEVPVVCAVEGGAAGAGLSLALACDLIVAARGSQFAARYVNAGLTPDGGLTHSLRACVPKQLAMEMCLLGRPQSAEKLYNLGVIATLTDPGEALQQAEAVAAEIANGPRRAQASILKLLKFAGDNSFDTVLKQEADVMAISQGEPEAIEGISAFLGKRSPVFPT